MTFSVEQGWEESTVCPRRIPVDDSLLMIKSPEEAPDGIIPSTTATTLQTTTLNVSITVEGSTEAGGGNEWSLDTSTMRH